MLQLLDLQGRRGEQAAEIRREGRERTGAGRLRFWDRTTAAGPGQETVGAVADFNPAEALLENGSLKAAVLPYDASR
jgi:hypothetical protein